MRRRDFLFAAAAASRLRASEPLIREIEQATFWNNLGGGGETWFHPRVCRALATGGMRLLMTLQTISGSDYYGPVHWSESRDLGRSWSEPQPIPGMGRHRNPDGVEEGYCDTVPELHPPTGTVIAMAHNVYYAGGKLTRPGEQRWPVYTVLGREGSWGPPHKLEWSHPEATAIYTSGCAQRTTLPDGDVLVPLSYGPLGRPDRGVGTVRCSFNGTQLRVKEHGNTLRLSAGRGLLEPSLAFLDGRHYMTIRAENNQGFVAASADGLRWEAMRAWVWDDGEPLALSTTQQRWLPHSGGLYLVYTRRHPMNVNVFRWRAPLFTAEVDLKTLRLIRRTERVVIPMNADGVKNAGDVEHQGNFHTTAISAEESLVTAGTVIPKNWCGAVRIARVRWSRPNGLL